MSIVRVLDQLGGTSRVSVARRLGEFKLVVTRPAIGAVRFALGLAIGIAGSCTIFALLYPYLRTTDGNVAPWCALGMSLWLLVFAFNDRRLRRKYRQEIEVTPSKLAVATSDFSNLPIPIEFEPAQITVTTTIPLIRGTIEFRERDSGRVLEFCENTPYYQRYFAAQKVAEFYDLEFTFDRELMEHEKQLVPALETEYERFGAQLIAERTLTEGEEE